MKLIQEASGKTVATSLTGAGVIVVTWLLSLFSVELPPEVAGALVLIAMTAISYFVPAKSGRYVITEPLGDGADPQEALVDSEYSDPIPEEVAEDDDSYVSVEEAK